MDTSVALTTIGAILTGAGGLFVVIHEFRRRDRRELRGTLEMVDDDLYRMTEAYIEMRRYALDVRLRLVDEGEVVDPPPMLTSREPPPTLPTPGMQT